MMGQRQDGLDDTFSMELTQGEWLALSSALELFATSIEAKAFVMGAIIEALMSQGVDLHGVVHKIATRARDERALVLRTRNGGQN